MVYYLSVYSLRKQLFICAHENKDKNIENRGIRYSRIVQFKHTLTVIAVCDKLVKCDSVLKLHMNRSISLILLTNWGLWKQNDWNSVSLCISMLILNSGTYTHSIEYSCCWYWCYVHEIYYCEHNRTYATINFKKNQNLTILLDFARIKLISILVRLFENGYSIWVKWTW